MKIPTLIIIIGLIFNISIKGSLLAEEDIVDNNSIDKILNELKRGIFFGEAGIYYELLDYSNNSFIEDDEIVKQRDSDLVVPYLKLDYVTPKFYGFSIGVGFTGYMNFGKKLDISNDTEGENINDDQDRDHFVFHQLFLRYEISQTTINIGRHQFDESVFLSEYYKALSITSNEINNLSLFFTIVEEVAEADTGVLIEYQNINRGTKSIDDYLFVGEATVNLMSDNNSITFYYYHKGNHYDLYGAHLELFHDTEIVSFGLNADIYATSEDNKNGMRDDNERVRNSDIYHINPLIEFGDFAISTGYIEADHDVGAREGGLLDDYFNPFNEGDKVYDSDAKTWYSKLSYESDSFDLELVFGSTDYRDGTQTLSEEEFNINTCIKFLDNFKLETEFSIIDSEGLEGNFRIFETALTYEF